ncbi:MAG: hypothetical protein ACTSU2_14925 [Promethearchaeota archaeon]
MGYDSGEIDKNIKKLRSHSGIVWALKVSNNEGLLASGAGDNLVKLWDLKNLKTDLDNKNINKNIIKKTYFKHREIVSALAFDPTDKLLASGGLDTYVYVYKLEHKDASPELPEVIGPFIHHSAIVALAFVRLPEHIFHMSIEMVENKGGKRNSIRDPNKTRLGLATIDIMGYVLIFDVSKIK